MGLTMTQNRTFNEILGLTENLEELTKKSTYAYEYTYLKEIVVDEELQKKYGKSREGFEKFKDELYFKDGEQSISYSAKKSLREVKSNGEITNYIIEERVSDTRFIEEAQKIYEEILSKYEDLFGVNDKENFYYLLDQSFERNLLTGESITNYLGKAEILANLYEKYIDEPEFKKYFDKIIK